MYRIRIAIALAVALAAAACGKSHTDQSSAPGHSPARSLEKSPPPESAGREAIPESAPEPVAEGFYLVAAGDTTASVDQLVVRAGEEFRVWVIADTEQGARSVNAVQYRLVVPDGVAVLHEDKVMKRVLTLGTWSDNFLITFPCHDPGRFPIMSYVLRTDDTFAGGTILVAEGVPRTGQSFLGFASCGEGTPAEKLPARGTSLRLIVQ